MVASRRALNETAKTSSSVVNRSATSAPSATLNNFTSPIWPGVPAATASIAPSAENLMSWGRSAKFLMPRIWLPVRRVPQQDFAVSRRGQQIPIRAEIRRHFHHRETATR